MSAKIFGVTGDSPAPKTEEEIRRKISEILYRRQLSQRLDGYLDETADEIMRELTEAGSEACRLIAEGRRRLRGDPADNGLKPGD
jgi:hypothetical protein